MVSGSVAGRERVVIVDRDLDFGLKVADHLASSGYHAVLARSLDAMLDDLSEMRPGAILLSDETPAEKMDGPGTATLRTLKALCPHAPVITFIKPPKDGSTALRSHSLELSTNEWSDSSRLSGVEEVLRAKLGIPCARVL